MIKQFNNLQDFDTAFPDEDSCVNHFRVLRFPSGIACVHCGSVEKIYDLHHGKHKCGDCRKTFTVRNGTIFEDSKLKLRLWFKAIFLMTSHKKGISSCQLAKDLGITQKTAWFVLNRIREAAKTGDFNRPLVGTIECDETYVGGKDRFKHASKRGGRRGSKGKIAVLGMLQREGELRLQKIQSSRLPHMVPALTSNIATGATVYTDESSSYTWMQNDYEHNLVKHSLGEYVRDDITTNRIEGVFGHFKRMVTGTYHKISDAHIDRYLTMFAFRWNRRTMGEGERVNVLLQGAKNRRLTYKELIGKE